MVDLAIGLYLQYLHRKQKKPQDARNKHATVLNRGKYGSDQQKGMFNKRRTLHIMKNMVTLSLNLLQDDWKIVRDVNMIFIKPCLLFNNIVYVIHFILPSSRMNEWMNIYSHYDFIDVFIFLFYSVILFCQKTTYTTYLLAVTPKSNHFIG